MDEFRRLNPGYEIKIHGEESLDSDWRRRYSRCQKFSSKSDIIRYCVLAREGGWYFDSDFWPLRPLDDAVRAWQLDGTTLFISKIRGHLSGDKLPYANGILGCAPGHPAIRYLRDRVLDTPFMGTVTYGPALVNDLVREMPAKLTVAEPGWFFPVTIDQTMSAAPYIIQGRSAELRGLREHTAGQLPFGAHFWNGSPAVDLDRAYSFDIDNTPVALIQAYDYRNKLHPLARISDGLAELGFYIEKRLPGIRDPDLVVCWNGKRPNNFYAEMSREHNIPCIYMEHGFYQRREFSQADPRGILHWSTWADHVAEEPPPAAYDRLAFHHPSWDEIEFAPRSGYVLILGQVPGDAQMIESEYDAPPAMLQQISRGLPHGVEAVFRQHPVAPPLERSVRRLCPGIDLRQGTDRDLYSRDLQAPKSLRDDMAGAKFCIAINSNALVEATAMGIPCLAFGPALGINAGVYHPTSARTLRQDMAEMLGGWHPDAGRAKAFLAWLAWIQYSGAELSEPEVVRCLCQRAGVRGF